MAYRNYSTAVGHIVDSNGLGDFLTISSAITAASSGQTIFVRPGTYTENLTLKPGVNIASYDGDSLTPNVTILGKLTLNVSGTVSISGIRLETNSDYFLVISGSSASIINISNSYLNCTNHTGISLTSSSASAALNIYDTEGDVLTTGISLYSMSGPGSILLNDVNIGNSGSSTTSSDNSNGLINYVTYSGSIPISTSGTGEIGFQKAIVDCGSINTTALTINGTGNGTVRLCTFGAGSAPAISIGTGATLIASHVSADSTNTNAIAGSGSLNAALIVFTSSSSTIEGTLTVHAFTVGP